MSEYTLSEAAALIGRSPTTLRNQVYNGSLRARLVGKTWVVDQAELVRYADAHRRPRLEVAFVPARRVVIRRTGTVTADTEDGAIAALDAAMRQVGHRLVTHDVPRRVGESRRWRVRSLIELNAERERSQP